MRPPQLPARPTGAPARLPDELPVLVPVRMPVRMPWSVDRCPPAPLVRSDQLCLPPGAEAEGAHHVLGDVLAVGPTVTAAHRAAALALLLPHRHGVVVRATAAWLWSGAPGLRPCRADLAVPPGAPPVPGPPPAAGRALPLRRTRWTASGWTLLGGLAVTDPVTTAAECARLLPAPLARRCVLAVLATSRTSPEAVAHQLRSGSRTGASTPRGTADGLALLDALRPASG